MSLPLPPKGPDEHDKELSNTEETVELQPGIRTKTAAKSDQDTRNVTFTGGIRIPSPDPSFISIDDSQNIRLGRSPDYLPVPDFRRHGSRSPASRPRTFKDRIRQFWSNNKGLALVMMSQMFGTLMNVTTRLLEIEGNHGRLNRRCEGL